MVSVNYHFSLLFIIFHHRQIMIKETNLHRINIKINIIILKFQRIQKNKYYKSLISNYHLSDQQKVGSKEKRNFKNLQLLKLNKFNCKQNNKQENILLTRFIVE